MAALNLPHAASQVAPVLTVSIGGATLAEAAPGEFRRESADDLFSAADGHLYRAKQAGRNRVVWRLPG